MHMINHRPILSPILHPHYVMRHIEQHSFLHYVDIITLYGAVWKLDK